MDDAEPGMVAGEVPNSDGAGGAGPADDGAIQPDDGDPEGSGGMTSEGMDPEEMDPAEQPAADSDGAPSAGCTAGASAPASGRYTIDVGGTEREYIIAVPTDYDPTQPYRLVFAWHPLGGSAQQVAGMGLGGGAYYGLQAQSDDQAIFVAPEGLPFNGNNLGWANTDGRDVAFARAMLERFGQELCVDQDRVFSTGFSFGGMMSFAAGCAMGDAIRAIAPMAGNIQVSGCPNGDAPVAVFGFHGDDDTVVGIDGGRAGRDVFVERNGCEPEATPAEPNWCDGLGQGEQPCSCVSYSGCDEGYPVIWCEFNGPHTPAPNSAATIWQFFSSF